MKSVSFAIAAAFVLMGQAGAAHDYRTDDLVIDHPMAIETPKMARSGGGYLTITNTGPEGDRLIGLRSPFPRAMLHRSEVTDGIARMSHVGSIEIPAGESVALEPGGHHIMFMDLGGDPFEVGETFPVTLVFEKAGEIEVIFNVEARNAQASGGMDHSGHGTGQDTAD